MELDSIKLANMLAELGRVFLVCKQGSPIEELCQSSKQQFIHLTVPFHSRAFSLNMLFRVRQIIKKNDIRNIVFFGASELKTLFFVFLGFDLNLIVRHGTTKTRPKHDMLHRLIYSRVNFHVALSEHLLNNVRYIMPPGENVRFVKIFPSFEFDSDNEHGEHDSSSGRIEIIHVGRIAGGKGQIDAVVACEALCTENIAYRFTMLGDPSNNDYSNALAKTIGGSECKDSYTMPGFVDDVAKYLRASDIFLFPSSGEGMPNSFIEALNQGCICIAYSNTVFPEFTELGFYLHLAKDNDIDDLTRILLQVCRNISSEREKTKVNHELVRKYFQRERELNDWHEILL